MAELIHFEEGPVLDVGGIFCGFKSFIFFEEGTNFLGLSFDLFGHVPVFPFHGVVFFFKVVDDLFFLFSTELGSLHDVGHALAVLNFQLFFPFLPFLPMLLQKVAFPFFRSFQLGFHVVVVPVEVMFNS